MPLEEALIQACCSVLRRLDLPLAVCVMDVPETRVCVEVPIDDGEADADCAPIVPALA